MDKKTWKIELGTASKHEVLLELSKRKVSLNAYATMLFMSERYRISEPRNAVTAVQVSVQEVGFNHGAQYADIVESASKQGLDICPLELAPLLRLAYPSQPEGTLVTIASQVPTSDEAYPNGFYLSANEAGLWLRGYRSTSDWIWPPESQFVFIQQNT